MIYLASPYSHPDPKIRNKRAVEITKIAAHLLSRKIPVFSPITFGHEVWKHNKDLPTDAAYWNGYNFHFLNHASELWVVRMKGWEESDGIKDEVAFAEQIKIPVKVFTVEELLNV